MTQTKKSSQSKMSPNDDTRTTTCGLFSWRPKWLQKFATHRYYLALYSLIGIIQGMTFSYVTVVLSTIEKQFGLKSTEAAWIYSGNEFSQILFIFFLPFVGRIKRRPLFMGLAIMMSVSGLLLMMLPHYTSEIAEKIRLGSSKNSLDKLLCDAARNSTQECNANGAPIERVKDYASLAMIFMGLFIMGIGGSFFYVFGLPYGDDNTEKGNSPMMIGIMWASRLLGPALGYFLGSACLRVYVNPSENAGLKEGDVLYLGAWWLGFPIIGALMLLCAPWFTLFPQRLAMTNTDASKIAESTQNTEISKSPIEFFKEMLIVYKRLLSKKLYFFNLLSLIFYLFGFLGYGTFLPKYLEYHYRQKASTAGSLGGVAKAVSGVFGSLISGYLIGRYKWHAKYVAGWNTLAGLIITVAFLIFMGLTCPRLEVQGHSENQSAFSTCNQGCKCQVSNYHPICSGDGQTVYFSPCEAGCTDHNGSFYDNCKCIDLDENLIKFWNKSDILKKEPRPILPYLESALEYDYDAKDGYCPVDCDVMFYTLLVLLFIISFLAATTKPSNALLMLRIINPQDKAASLSLIVSSVSLFGFLPAPFVYGYLIDTSCIIWDVKCSSTTNCLVYDTDQMRHLLNGVTAFFIFIATVCDVFVVYYARNLDLYDQEEANKKIEALGNKKYNGID